MKVVELKALAKEHGLRGYSRLKKAKLTALLPEHLVMLLAGPISHTSTQYIDFVNFLHFNGSVYQLFCSF